MRSNNRFWILAGCGALTFVTSSGQAAPPPSAQAAAVDGPATTGPSYQVGGVTYTPADTANYDEVGYVGWYGDDASGKVTANGEAFLPDAVTGAHKTLPMPSYVEVTALDSGRTILVRINDRGPLANDKIIALSHGAAEQLGIVSGSTAAVRVRRVNPPEQEKILLRSHGRAPERIAAPPALIKALRLRLPQSPVAPVARPVTAASATAPDKTAVLRAASPLPARPGVSYDGIAKPAPMPAAPASVPARSSATPAPVASKPPAPAASGGGYVVQVAALSSRSRADALARQIGAQVAEGAGMWRIRYGPYPTQAAAQAGMKAAAAKGFENARIMANDAR